MENVYLLAGVVVGWFGFWMFQILHGQYKLKLPVLAAHVLPIKKSDILVITAPGDIPEETASRIKMFIAEQRPGTKTLVLGSGMTLSVVQQYGEE